MTQQELHTIIQSGEGYKTEFKRAVNTDLSKEMVAFANASGGRILIGVEDDGTVHGLPVDNALRARVEMMAKDCDPSIPVELEVVSTVLVVHVPEGRHKPYRSTGGFYIRTGSVSVKLSTQEIIEFIQSEGRVKFDELRNERVAYPNGLDEAAVRRYKKLAGIDTALDTEALLTNLGVLYQDEKGPVLNNAGVLFFGKAPALAIPQSAVTCVLFKGTEKVDVIDRKTFEADLLTNIDEALLFLKRHLNLSYEIKTVQRKEIMEIPEVALREAVVNAVAHRDYFEKGAGVMVEMYDDRVLISDPGGLPKGLKPENFGVHTLARNSLIASLLHRAGYIEKIGTGILRIRKAMANAGLPEPEFGFSGFFTVVLKKAYTAKVGVDLEVTAARKERIFYLLRQLKDRGELNVKEISEQLHVPVKNIRRDLLLLVEKGWIVSGGTTSNRFYQLTDFGREQLEILDGK